MCYFIIGLLSLVFGFTIFGESPGLGEPVGEKTPVDNPMVVLSTTHGEITIELFPQKAPITVKNFMEYVDAGFYDNTIFHRVIPEFMIQAGGITKDFKKKQTRPPIKNEADNSLRNSRGTISMARTQDVNSATSQFFINLKDNTFLDHMVRDYGYAVFGKVISGMDVVDRIAALPTGTQGMYRNLPIETVIIKSARRK